MISLINRVIAPCELKRGLWKTLKSGVDPGFPEQETPQDCVISLLLANIAVDRIENCGIILGIRYADNMVFVVKSEQDDKAILGRIKSYLGKI